MHPLPKTEWMFFFAKGECFRLEPGELTDSIVAFFATVQSEGLRKVERQIAYYNLDMIISVGYRVNF